METLFYVPPKEIKKIQKAVPDPLRAAPILADIFRLNTLYMIRYAGSGHIGSSFSAMDIVTWLWTADMRDPNEPKKEVSDTYFSSKGHDAPGLYAALIGLGKLDAKLIHGLRRLGGLPGHPDVGTPYMATNTGPLGMGISKARGMAIANRSKGRQGRFYVLTGDGELQEGQLWESLQPTANRKFSEITVIVDHNKIQSDIRVKDTSDLGDLEAKFRVFGWEVERVNGHDFNAIRTALARFKKIKNRPQALIADTVKGKGVSFMEKMSEDGLYKFHSGAPGMDLYRAAVKELADRVNARLAKLGLKPLAFSSKQYEAPTPLPHPEKLVSAYGDELVKIARERTDLVAMDADLVLDTGLIPFKKAFPDRYFECGIAEQDMVSMAGGLALYGMLPVVHSFACFLTTRPNEQMYNNISEKKKIIYAGSLAGLLPAPPGHSHQSVRDISAIGGMPHLVMIEPSNEAEARMGLRWAVEKHKESTYIRLVSIPCETPYSLPKNYRLEAGKGTVLVPGTDAVMFAYGPVMLSEAVRAAELLRKKKISLAVINLPWLNRINTAWLSKTVRPFGTVFTLDDHYVSGGQGEKIGAAIARKSGQRPKVVSWGVEEIPACGENRKVLAYHGLDAASLAKRVLKELKGA